MYQESQYCDNILAPAPPPFIENRGQIIGYINASKCPQLTSLYLLADSLFAKISVFSGIVTVTKSQKEKKKIVDKSDDM